MTQAQLAQAVWPGSDGEDRKGDISKLETGKVSNPHESTVLAICRALELDMAQVNALRLAPPPDPHFVADFVKDLATKSRDQIYILAREFGEPEPEGKSDAWLMAFLTEKAKEIERLLAQVAALKGLSDKIDNIHGAALDAIANENLGEAYALLDGALEIQRDVLRKPLEVNAALMEAKAGIDLLRNRVEQAHALLSAAADSFAAVDPLETAWRRWAAGVRLTEHGQRYGGAGLPLAIRLLTRLIDDLPRAADPWLWAAARNSRATALQVQGTRTAGAAGTALLAQAVADYTDALEVFTRADHPLNWAMTLQNRAVALEAQGTRTAGAAGTALLAQAVADCTDALEVFTRADHPVQWAMTLQNRAIALAAQGSRTAGEAGTDLLAQAVADFRDALEVRTRADHPVDWATTLQNRANVLAEQGRRTAGVAGTALLAQAVADYTAAL